MIQKYRNYYQIRRYVYWYKKQQTKCNHAQLGERIIKKGGEK
ncbi:hypothetical protein D930_00395 [Enterococcus faecalis KI-6-1-110608-1]|nr:hypothetical protein D930_00395 [Enterococcus faecalis KI-6-1-110608-1]